MSIILFCNDDSDTVEDYVSKAGLLLARAADLQWESDDGRDLFKSIVQEWKENEDFPNASSVKRFVNTILTKLLKALELNIASCERWGAFNGIVGGINMAIPTGINQVAGAASLATAKSYHTIKKKSKEIREDVRTLLNRY